MSALLSEPPPVIGLYHFYTDSSYTSLFVVHKGLDYITTSTVATTLQFLEGRWTASALPKHTLHQGVFRSLSEIYNTFPEYFI